MVGELKHAIRVIFVVVGIPLEDVDVCHLREMLVVYSVSPDGFLGRLLGQEVSISIHEPVD